MHGVSRSDKRDGASSSEGHLSLEGDVTPSAALV